MTDTIIPNRFLVRGGTAAAIASLNEVPKAREIVFETDSLRFKLGNGSTNYNSLPYVRDYIFDFGAVAGGVESRANAGIVSDFRWLTGTSYRWIARRNGDAEAGANAGSNFEFHARADDGSLIGIAYSITRATRVFDFKVAPTLNGVALAYTDENAQDAIAAMIAAGTHTGITITYSDVGNSLSFVVSGGGGSGSALGNSVTQAAHGFSVGMPITYTAGAWVQSDRDSSSTMADAIVSAVASSSVFTYVLAGEVTLTTGQWDSRTGESGGLTAGDYYYLSSTAGGMTKTAPTAGNSQVIGKALSTTLFLAFVSPPVDVATTTTTTTLNIGVASQVPNLPFLL